MSGPNSSEGKVDADTHGKYKCISTYKQLRLRVLTAYTPTTLVRVSRDFGNKLANFVQFVKEEYYGIWCSCMVHLLGGELMGQY
jgi:hypothetical protein